MPIGLSCYELNCNSKNVVFLLSCKRCEMQYVGSTILTGLELGLINIRADLMQWGIFHWRPDLKRNWCTNTFFLENTRG